MASQVNARMREDQPFPRPSGLIPIECSVQEVPEGLRVSVSGELDMDSVVDFDRVAGEILAADPRSVVVDLGSLSFLDSMGLLAFLRLAHGIEERGGEIVFVRPTEAVRRLFELAGADQRLTIRDRERARSTPP